MFASSGRLTGRSREKSSLKGVFEMFGRNGNRHSVLLLVLGLVCFLSAAVLIHSFKGRFGQDTVGKITVDLQPGSEKTTDSEPSEKTPRQVAAVTEKVPEEKSGEWEVYITGAVISPGVYAVPAGSRIHAALKAAGGFSAEADIEAVNLAEKLADGSHIRFPAKGEAPAPERVVQDGVSNPSAVSARAPGPKVVNGLVDINSAGSAEFQRLPGIGPKTAGKIINYREKNGAFARKEDLLLINGIGPAKYDALKDLVTVER